MLALLSAGNADPQECRGCGGDLDEEGMCWPCQFPVVALDDGEQGGGMKTYYSAVDNAGRLLPPRESEAEAEADAERISSDPTILHVTSRLVRYWRGGGMGWTRTPKETADIPGGAP